MSHKGNGRGKGRPDKARPAVQHTTAPRAVKVVASPPSIPAEAAPPPLAETPAPANPPSAPVETSRTRVPAPAANPVSQGAATAPPATPGGQLAGAPTPNGHSAPAHGMNGHSNGNGDAKSSKHITQQTPTPPSELTNMFETMRALFVRDRANGARPDAARCGICYLTFAREELTYHEEAGFYACPDCQAALHAHTIHMLRRQRR